MSDVTVRDIGVNECGSPVALSIGITADRLRAILDAVGDHSAGQVREAMTLWKMGLLVAITDALPDLENAAVILRTAIEEAK